ncbi:hypothetical protein NMY22_g135 [Coprinellus aureogranulatus]|nr:hypothetical protein NMY22_g135 [Coprinellus aureogranulatus]
MTGDIRTVLLEACAECSGEFDTVDFLLDHGADPNASGLGWDYYGTPLIFACSEGNIELVSRLLARGADPNLRAPTPVPCEYVAPTALLTVCTSDKSSDHHRLEVMKALLEHGANPDLAGPHPLWRSVLHACLQKGYVDCARAVLEHGADPNLKNMFGYTPLCLTCCRLTMKSSRSTEMAELLLDFGADPSLRNDGNKSALQEAIGSRGEDSDIVRMLRRRGITE